MSIVQTVYENDFIDAFVKYGRENNFSYYARVALYEYYEDYSDSIGEDYELDVIGICCEWTEYTKNELISDYSYLIDEIEVETEFREENGLDTTTDNNDDTYEKFFVEPLDDDYVEEFNDFLFEKIIEELENKTTIIRVKETNRFNPSMNVDSVLVAEF